ncbi:signal peptidase I [Altericista sp. CCNU0014]|uniref:signal peptidase I n=1 Tax=Altericista sp. CCNU0014 TaxID=3082949 RepID=UPI00384FF55D
MKPKALLTQGFTTLPGIAVLSLLYILFTLKLFPAISIFVYLILLIALFTYPIGQYLQHRRALKVLQAIGAALITVIATVILIRQVFFQPAYVVNHGMSPNLPAQTRIVGDRTSYWFRQPQRSDIILWESAPQDSMSIMRIVGLPGDRVEVRQGEVWIDSKQLEERYTVDRHAGELASCPTMQLARGKFYVLLDDRAFHRPEDCTDRTISRQQIIAKVVGQFYSANGFSFSNF